MFRIDDATAAAALPAPGAPGVEGFFTPGDPGLGVPATKVKYHWLNTIQEELVNVIDAAGIVRDKADNTQLLDAINALIAGALPTIVQDRVYVETAAFFAGVADGNVVYWDAGGAVFKKAQAGTANNKAIGVADVTGGKVTIFGKHTAGMAAMTVGAKQYLSAATAGLLTEAAPAEVIVVGIAKAAGELWVDIDADQREKTDVYRTIHTSDTALGTCATGGTQVGSDIAVELAAGDMIRLTMLEGRVSRASGAAKGSAALGLQAGATSYFNSIQSGWDSSGPQYHPAIGFAGIAGSVKGGFSVGPNNASSAAHPCQAVFDVTALGIGTGAVTLKVKMGDVAQAADTDEGQLDGASVTGVFMVEVLHP